MSQGSPRGGASTKDVPTAVRSLLTATKSLQEKLRLWSIEKASESDVSDCYVSIGNEFNATINAFGVYEIELSEIYSVPKDLREILENCLGEDPSPQVLNTFMPEVRRVLFHLYQGLQAKQPFWQRAVMENGNGQGTPPSYMDSRS